MKNIWKLTLNKTHIKSLPFVFFFFGIFTSLDKVFYHKFNEESLNFILGNFGIALSLSQLYFIFLASILMTLDFHIGTSKIIFTGIYKRSQIIHAKILRLFMIMLLFAFFDVFIGFVFQVSLVSEVVFLEIFKSSLQVIFAYCLFFIGIVSFSLFTSSLFLNRFYTILINYVSFILVGDLIVQAAERSMFDDIMQFIPFYLVTSGFNRLYYPLSSIFIIVAFSLTMYIMGLIIFCKRDL